MSLRVVSENSQADIAKEWARRDVSQALRELAANLLRVTRGAGKSYALIGQAIEFVEAVQAYEQKVGQRLDPAALEAMLRYRDAEENSEASPYDDVEFAKREISRAGLQVVASRLLRQSTQISRAESDLVDAIRYYREAIEAAKAARRPQTYADLLKLRSSAPKSKARASAKRPGTKHRTNRPDSES